MHDLPLITTIAAGFAAAWVLGLISHRIGLSPIVGYLLAGVALGKHTPGFIADEHIAHQLAEVGVILLMFGVGLHFHPKDLIAVKGIAIPGAIGQSLMATIAAAIAFQIFGMTLTESMVIGFAMAVASTVVLMRVLMDAGTLNSPQGHAAVGWLIVEDVLTVILLVLIPFMGSPASKSKGEALAAGSHALDAAASHAPAATSAAEPIVTAAHTAVETAAAGGGGSTVLALGLALVKLAVFVALVILAGKHVVPKIMVWIARQRSRELFTLTVLVLSIAVAAGAYFAFGASMALGAFLGGMMVAQSPVSHQAGADALPLRDAFAVLFFVSVGMLFDPSFLVNHPGMALVGLAIVLIVKPLTALVIVAVLGYPIRTGLTVAIGLAQIGEFSFIVSQLADAHGIMPEAGKNVIIAAAIVSITINPLLFRLAGPIEDWVRRKPRLWKLLNGRAERRLAEMNHAAEMPEEAPVEQEQRLAVIVGYGPVGAVVEKLVRENGMNTLVIDMNADTVLQLKRDGKAAIYGDASNETVLEQAHVNRASHLIVTLPDSADRAAVVTTARNLNPDLRILVRARYLREQETLAQAGATAAIFEESEAAVALSRLVLTDAGVESWKVGAVTQTLRNQYGSSVAF